MWYEERYKQGVEWAFENMKRKKTNLKKVIKHTIGKPNVFVDTNRESLLNPSIEDGNNIYEQEENPTSFNALLTIDSVIAKTEPVTTTTRTNSLYISAILNAAISP